MFFLTIKVIILINSNDNTHDVHALSRLDIDLLSLITSKIQLLCFQIWNDIDHEFNYNLEKSNKVLDDLHIVALKLGYVSDRSSHRCLLWNICINRDLTNFGSNII